MILRNDDDTTSVAANDVALRGGLPSQEEEDDIYPLLTYIHTAAEIDVVSSCNFSCCLCNK